MSFWDNVKKFAQPYSDDDYDDDDDYLDDYDEPTEPAHHTPRRGATPAPAPVSESAPSSFGYTPTPATAPVAPAPAPTMPPLSASAPVSTGFTGSVLSSSRDAKQEVILFRPASFNDTSKAADDLRNRKAVIVNMENVDKAMARRVVDFLSGCVYALNGTVKKIAQSAYLFCPQNMDVVGDLENIQAEVESYI